MNEYILNLFKDFGTPVYYLQYEGDQETYITFQPTIHEGLYGDDGTDTIKQEYDFDIFSKNNYKDIEKRLIKLLLENDFVRVMSGDSSEMYETDTKYYHKTLCFERIVEE